MTVRRAAVLGAGSWGTALAKTLADKGNPVRLWARREAVARSIESQRENTDYLPGVALPANVEATADVERALDDAEVILCVVPSHGVRRLLQDTQSILPPVPICAAIKGIENSSQKLVSEIFEELLPPAFKSQITFLGGPSFAKEVAAGIPTAVAVAGRDPVVCESIQRTLSTDRFRVYTTDDIIGLELGGALKNVIAIAAGIADGLGFGHNTRAALITRGLAEMSRLAGRMGADPLTMAGLGGMGDLVLTCTGNLSRNRSVGLELGRGKSLESILSEMNMVAEGVRTTKSAHALAQQHRVDMPIVAEVYQVLYGDKSPRDAVATLMSRPLKSERS